MTRPHDVEQLQSTALFKLMETRMPGAVWATDAELRFTASFGAGLSALGLQPNEVSREHFGLEGIRQRVRLLGGRLKIASEPGSGTVIQALVPIVQERSEP